MKMRFGVVLITFLMMCPTLQAGEYMPSISLTIDSPVREKAISRYLNRPSTELSKLVYLIDVFTKADVEVVYDGFAFRPSLMGGFIRKFLLSHYQDEKAADWIDLWCRKTKKNNLIEVRFPDGSGMRASDYLFQELSQLELKTL